jgi:Flp pilus assembly protein TadG
MKPTIVSIFWHRFRDDRRGNVAMIAALSMLGLVGTAGIGIDYFNALAAKSRLDLASDAAAIAAITRHKAISKRIPGRRPIRL